MEENVHYYKVFGFNRKFKTTERRPPPDVTDVFSFCTNSDSQQSQMSPDQFRRFLIEFQVEKQVTIDDAKRIMEKVLHRFRPNFTLCSFTIDDFFSYLFLDDLNAPIPLEVRHDMTAPLHHYFIYTGHNSYLTGNQIYSDCSERPIVEALLKGVRVIELDLWPNSAKDGIHVLHGWAMTTPVRLSKCLKSIKENAFVKSPYPVIITLEDHLTPNLQAKVAEMATEIFGDMLYRPKTGDNNEFPSPEELKYHIILSTKPPKEDICENGNTTDERINSNQDTNMSSLNQNLSQFMDFEDEDGDDKPGEKTPPKYKHVIGIHAAKAKKGLRNALKAGSGIGKRLSLSEQTLERAAECYGTNLVSLNQNFSQLMDLEDEDVEKTPPKYIHVIGIHAAKAKKGLRNALKVGSVTGKRLSLSEQTLERAAEHYGTDLVGFTQKNFVRVFPSGTRITSTNFKPLLAWMHGAQMVASNMQGYGRSLWIMHGMFRSNGGCGYVKKPDFLMSRGPNNEVFDPKAKLHVKKILKVKVYMGDGWHMDFEKTHFDRFSPPDFYTKMYMVGVPADVTKRKTRVIKNDWTPMWDEELTFPLTVPELALLKIVVRDNDVDKDDFAGQTCLPVSELKSGIRSVPLYNEKGEKFKFVKLLMRFAFE